MSDATAADTSARPQHLIITVFGIYARTRPVAVADLISLMADLGVEPGAVRSTVSRLKGRGMLISTRTGGIAAYRLSDALESVYAAGDRRIFAQQRAQPTSPWLLASFTVPERERPVRHRLRSLLTQLGFGQVNGGLWIAPGHVLDEARAALAERGLAGYVDLFLGTHVNNERATQQLAQWWDLPAIAARYQEFLATHGGALRQPASGASAFSTYVSAITAWRRFPYLDPGLPLAALPAQWPGIAAEALFHAIHDRFSVAAAEYADTRLTLR
ncbi:PaaX family transcriptional regulator [Leucobacter chromiireducens]|uniref:PaaX family transcriptional regulator n=1 Tax=Leucobacter chromiireducens TaxID=283877 RepID=UPI000F63784F|nr:PaaX family transcriptional regulator C-terminal domain-containing protein [Leucobacter chromiireducens]